MKFVLAAVLGITFFTSVATNSEELDCQKSGKPCHCQKFADSQYTFICQNSSDIIKDARKAGQIENFFLTLFDVYTTMDFMPDGYFDGLKVDHLIIAYGEIKITEKTLKGLEPHLESLTITGTKTDVVPNLVEFKRLERIKFNSNTKVFNGTLNKWSMDRLPNENVFEISIAQCAITSMDDGVFKRFKKLKILKIGVNLLTTLPNDPFPDNLITLEIWKNLFTSPPTNAILNSKNLKTINFHKNNIIELKEDEFSPLMKKGCRIVMNHDVSCSCDLSWIWRINEDPYNKGRIEARCREGGKRNGLSVPFLKKNDFNDC